MIWSKAISDGWAKDIGGKLVRSKKSTDVGKAIVISSIWHVDDVQGPNGSYMAKTLATVQYEQSGQKIADKNMAETSKEFEGREEEQYNIFCNGSLRRANKTAASEMLLQNTGMSISSATNKLR